MGSLWTIKGIIIINIIINIDIIIIIIIIIKLANLLYAKGLSKHLCKKGREQMTICSVHPGVITSTQLFKQSIATKIFSKIFPGDRNTGL